MPKKALFVFLCSSIINQILQEFWQPYLIGTMARYSLLKTYPWSSRSHLLSRTSARRQWQRFYSIQTTEDAIARLPGMNPDSLHVTKTTKPMSLLPPEELVFGRSFTGISDNPGSRCKASNQNYRPYVLDRVDCRERMAAGPNNPLPKSQPRPRNLCLSLCI